jgi:hypothetical protein
MERHGGFGNEMSKVMARGEVDDHIIFDYARFSGITIE